MSDVSYSNIHREGYPYDIRNDINVSKANQYDMRYQLEVSLARNVDIYIYIYSIVLVTDIFYTFLHLEQRHIAI